mgnify:CR=1 FL=1
MGTDGLSSLGSGIQLVSGSAKLFGARLREYRKRSRKTTQEVADRCRCTRNDVLFIERIGRAGIVDAALLRRILQVIGRYDVNHTARRLAVGYDWAMLPSGRIHLSLSNQRSTSASASNPDLTLAPR